MIIKLEDLWDELEFDETLKEYVEGKVVRYIKKINSQINCAIKARMESAIADISDELATIKGFAKCADTKINRHLLSHCELPKELEQVKET